MTDNNSSDNGRDQHGRFSTGNPGKPKGSAKNKMRDQVKDFLNNNWPSFQTWFDELKPKEKVDVMIDLMPFALPRLQATTTTDGDDVQQSMASATIDYSKLSPRTLKEILSHTKLTNHE